MAYRVGETFKIRKRHPPQHNRQEKRRESDNLCARSSLALKRSFFTFVGLDLGNSHI